PVLPEVGSTMVPPGRSLTSFSAASIIVKAILSLIEPPGFIDSTFATRFPAGWRRDRRTSGVSPMALMIESRICMGRGHALGLQAAKSIRARATGGFEIGRAH